jgi:glucose/mannose-6-phosphate isomerase
MIDNLIADFSKHLTQALEIAKATQFKSSDKTFNNVLICGLGGSGIGGTIVSQLVNSSAECPIVVNKNYIIPNFVNENTLVLCCSYSGNTEETLVMCESAKKKGAEIVVISSGGKFIELAKEYNHNYIQIPGDFPPRAAFGLSFPQIIQVLAFYKIIPNNHRSEILKAVDLINKEELAIKTEAKEIARQLVGKTPIIYADATMGGVAIRFRQQLNENGKMLCWHHVIPEMNHNELVGWTEKIDDKVVVLLKTGLDYTRNQKRMEYNKENIISNCTNNIIEINSKGDSLLENFIYHIHLEDWVSFFVADFKKIDAVEVNVIDGLKNFLSTI